jgi:HAD superfamily hydrolase (TIGR01509 family)
MMARLKALLFDVDGTLADTEANGHRVAFNKAFVEAGLDWHWGVELYADLLLVTGGKERLCYYFEEHLKRCDDHSKNTALAANLHKLKTKHYLHMLQEGEITLRPGVERLLNEARGSDLRLAIVTTTTPANVSFLLKANLGEDAPDWFEVIAAGDCVLAKKPAADIYHYTLKAMGLKADEVLAIEDSENGLVSATAAGINTIVTCNDYTQDQNFDDALIVLNKMGEKNDPFIVLDGDAGEHEFLNMSLIHFLYAQTN